MAGLLLLLNAGVALSCPCAATPALAPSEPSVFSAHGIVSDYKLPPGDPRAEQTPVGDKGPELSGGFQSDSAGLAPISAGETKSADPLPLELLSQPSLAEGNEDKLEPGTTARSRYNSFGSQVSSVKWEIAAVAAYYTAINSGKLLEDPIWPHFHNEGWFGKSTDNVGVDKLAHGYSTYVLSELFYSRLKHKTGDASGIQYTAAAIASVTMLYTELWDSIERSSGWSWQDVTFDLAGAGFSIIRNSVPGLDKKLDYRLMIVPNSNLFNAEGKKHFEQQRYFFALKLSGFEAFQHSPLRFLELHAGYYAKDFSLADRAANVEPKRRIFLGFGINLRELFFKNARSRVGRAAGEVLDYFQPPYTAVQAHITN